MIDKKILLDEVNDYFEMETHDCEWYVTKGHSTTKVDDINATIQRMLGIAQFVQVFDIDYEEIEPIYEKYRRKCLDLKANL